jgi:2-polyprenyl-3-methyl-5-hydroxy-6-metoxy-1,4-benzoquinol methylase
MNDKDKIKRYYCLLRPEIVNMIPMGCSVVLDVGCGSGSLGKHLKENGVKEVFGIELSADAAKEARSVLDHVIEGNAETMGLPFKRQYFECIVCADVLEHLFDPWSMVNRLKGFLKPGGVIVASIPNVGFHRIIKGLIKGKWQYADEGVLDRTHLRFFTLKGIEELFATNDMTIEKIYRKIDAGVNMKIFNSLCLNKIRESLVIQYIVRAKIS